MDSRIHATWRPRECDFERFLVVAAYVGGMTALAALAYCSSSCPAADTAAFPPGASPAKEVDDGSWRRPSLASGIVGIVGAAYVALQQGPPQYYLYVWYAVILW